jgi:hypothetical protein
VLFELQPTPTPREWGLIIGDALFNCRSALDQFANVLAGGDPDDRVTAFPVCVSEAMFSSPKTQGELSRMSSDAVALVEEAQPYRGTRTNHPEYDELWVLHELCNTDKHRALHLTSRGFDGASARGEIQIAASARLLRSKDTRAYDHVASSPGTRPRTRHYSTSMTTCS